MGEEEDRFLPTEPGLEEGTPRQTVTEKSVAIRGLSSPAWQIVN